MTARDSFATTGRLGARACIALALAGAAAAQVTIRVNLSSSGEQGNSHSQYPAITPDGRHVAFGAWATNLVAGDTNGFHDVFVQDRQAGTIERVNVHSSGAQANNHTFQRPAISADGRYVAFGTGATNLVTGDTNGEVDVFVRDRQSGTTERVSLGPGGAEANNYSDDTVAISADGRYVAFLSAATNLVGGGTIGFLHAFVRDRQAGTTELVDVTSAGIEGNNGCRSLAMSPDGRYVAFGSFATNLVAGDTNAQWDGFVRDRQAGTTERVSVDSTGIQGNGRSAEFNIAISADGNCVAFTSLASNLVSGDTNGQYDVFLRDRQAGTTERISVHSSGAQGNDASGINNDPSISADGRYAVFVSGATNLVTGDTNGDWDVFLRDRQAGTTERVSIHSSGAQGNEYSGGPNISPDGRYIVFDSGADNLVPGDTNDNGDIFVRDRGMPPLSVCDPAVAGVLACPCSNTPSGLERGCNNSASTGGASLRIAGDADLSADTLVFTTSGQLPSTLSVLVQGDAATSSGAAYGRGVRCAGGTLRTLYTKTASGGSITAPDSGAGDPTVSARSAALGDPLSAGQTRWYFVGYRDPIAFCPAPFAMTPRQTFNATQTWQVLWQ